MALGNVAWGVPLQENFLYQGNLLHQVHLSTVLTGLLVVSMFLMHGADPGGPPRWIARRTVFGCTPSSAAMSTW